jgi:hypothetical protein
MCCSRELKTFLGMLRVDFDKFLGKHKAPNYRTLFENMPETFRDMGCSMSLKLHFFTVSLSTPTKQPWRWCQWWTWCEISPRYLHHRKTLPRETQPSNTCWLQLTTQKRHSFYIQEQKRKASVKQFSWTVFSVRNSCLYHLILSLVYLCMPVFCLFSLLWWLCLFQCSLILKKLLHHLIPLLKT